jgi:hypothetical protein
VLWRPDVLNSLPNEVGESTSTNNGMSGGTRQTHFESQFELASTIPGSEQPGLYMSVSADRGDGRSDLPPLRGFGLRINVFFDDYRTSRRSGPGNEETAAGPAATISSRRIGTCLTRTPHTFRTVGHPRRTQKRRRQCQPHRQRARHHRDQLGRLLPLGGNVNDVSRTVVRCSSGLVVVLATNAAVPAVVAMRG